MLQSMEEKKNTFPLLVADIGGTNANFGVIDYIQGRYQLVEYYRLPSQKITNFTHTVDDLIKKLAEQKHMSFSVMVIGVAGSMCGDQHAIQPTHLPFKIDKPELMHATGIAEIFLMNDFISIIYGYNLVNNTIAIHACAVKERGQKAFLGAGTGLGQAYAVWSRAVNQYIPVASEGGHVLFAPDDTFDQQLAAFIQEQELFTLSPTWETVLSGKGISHIYAFLGTQKKYDETAIAHEIARKGFQPDDISAYSEHDLRCKETFKLYARYYARYAQQVALEAVACGGLYIAGGIAAKNKKLFLNQEFLRTFFEHVHHRKLLEKIPIFLIQDYQVSLYGSAHYYALYSQGIL